ncbi:MAG TPA: STAS domain-containing protein [Candidatus Limnocylindrales bacterium]|jgi:anti-sigma B factor antagonist|nr:STAS domain-containing protein [Candidatus Limnocylindrales bacterium]
MANPGTRVEVRSTGDPAASVVAIFGDVTGGSEPALMDAYVKAVDGGARTIVFDFAGLEYMNSGGIGLLVTMLVRAKRQGQRLLAVGLSEHYREIFSLIRLDEAIGIHDDANAALAASRA